MCNEETVALKMSNFMLVSKKAAKGCLLIL